MSLVSVIIWTVLRVAAAVLFVGWAALHLRVLDDIFGVSLPEWFKPVGSVLICVGAVVVLVCGGMLSTPRVIPDKFVVLDPMSLGAVTMMCGLSLLCRSISILLLSALLFLLMHIFVVFVEEPGLEKRFGASYVQYKHSVNRWFPTLR